MRKSFCLAGLVLLLTHTLFAQDEGTIVKRERIDRSQGFFLSFGPSFTLDKNLGDYSTGLNVEAGYMKRLNRVFSIGPSISYIGFKYDPAKTKSTNVEDLYQGTADDLNDWHATYDPLGLPPDLRFRYGFLLNLTGGDLSLISLAVNLKVNFIPITDTRKFSVYGFAKPFVSYFKREAVEGKGERFVYETFEEDDILYYNQGDQLWYPDGFTENWGPSDQYPVLEEKTKVTGGIFIGPGVEFWPAGKLSIFGQVSFGYTFPISYVSTESYPKTSVSYLSEEFPIVEEGFPSVNLQFGASFNF